MRCLDFSALKRADIIADFYSAYELTFTTINFIYVFDNTVLVYRI